MTASGGMTATTTSASFQLSRKIVMMLLMT